MPIVTLSKSIRRAAFGAWIGAKACGAAVMACGPRWMSAAEDRVEVRGFREFMQ